MVEQAAAMGHRLDAVISCCGGGGLMSGIATAVHAVSPETRLFAAEPEGYDDTRRSLEAGTRVANDGKASTICDAIMTPTPGRLTFPINRRLLSGALVVSDGETLRAMAVALRLLKLVVEPGGAVALAAALSGKLPEAVSGADCDASRVITPHGPTIGIVCSGGNVDLDMLARAITTD
jgi:threonine dehydratase